MTSPFITPPHPGEEVLGTIYERVRIAARMRARDYPWEEIGKVIGVSPETCKNYRPTYRYEWNESYEDELGQYIGELEIRALKASDDNLSAPKPFERQAAARDLLHHARELRGTKKILEVTGLNGGPIVQCLKNLTEEELERVVAIGKSDPNASEMEIAGSDETEAVDEDAEVAESD